MRQLHLFSRPNCPKCNSYKNFVDRYKLNCKLQEQGDLEAEKMALSLHVHNVPQFVIEDEGLFDIVDIDKLVELVDNGEFQDAMRIKEEEQKKEDVVPEDIQDFYE